MINQELKPTKKRLFKQLREITKRLPEWPVCIRGKKTSSSHNHYRMMKREYSKGGRKAVNEYIVRFMPELKPLL